MSQIRRNCIVCLKELYGAMNGELLHDFVEPPSGAIVFTATGNYGSQVWDSMGKEILEVSLCDCCALERSSVIYHGERYKESGILNIKTLREKRGK